MSTDIIAESGNIVDFEIWMHDTGRLRPLSAQLYSRAVRAFLLTSPDIADPNAYNMFIIEHAIKKRSTYYHSALRKYAEFLYKKKNRLLYNQIMDNTEHSRPTIKDREKHFINLDDSTRDGIIALLDDPKHKLIAKLQNTVGIRAGDALRLKRKAVRYEADNKGAVNMVLHIDGKGGRKHPVWIFDKTLQMELEAFIKTEFLDTEYVFMERGRSYDPTNYAKYYWTNYKRYYADLKRAIQLAGIDYADWATHDWRRSVARRVWDKYKDLVILKSVLNHKDVNTTLRYIEANKLQAKDAMENLYYDSQLKR